MELRVLGPVEVYGHGRAVPAGPPQQRAVLAALAVDAGRSVPVDVLVDRVWGPHPPARVRRTLHTHLTRIRRLLEQAGAGSGRVLVARRASGYLLDIEPATVDLHRFRQLVDLARDPGRPDDRRLALLREAVELGRRRPLTGVPGQWADRFRDGWRQHHLAAVVAWAQAELRAGNPAAVVATVTDLVDEHPLVEPLTAVLMRALYAAGHKAEALACYATTARRLVEELGVDPGAELRQAYQEILRGDLDPATTDRSAPAEAVGADRPAVPAQLPAKVPGFAGRTGALARLDALLDRVARQPSAVVAVLSGTAGVGKTALAVHWGHRVADRFPDGQLHVDLRGFGPSGEAVTPAQAVRGLLDALGVPATSIPATPHGQVGLYRSLLAGRRILVLLDNARDADQVRPLLPATPGCLAVVTSRNQLSGLVAAEGARPLTLDLPTVEECRWLLARRLGTDAVAAEPDAVDDLVAHCARLPLALVVVAARAAGNPAYPLAVLAKELAETPRRLDAFAGPDPATDLRSVFSWSYRTLTPDAARLFRLVGVHTGPDIGAPAAASLAALPLPRTRQLLGELSRAHLVTESAPGRYACHDLLRAYAGELAEAD